MKFDNYMILDFPSKSANEAFARSAVACFAAQMDPTLEELGDIRTAVSEAVTNCIVHAYPEKLGNITLRCRILKDNVLDIVIKDKGVRHPGHRAGQTSRVHHRRRGTQRNGLYHHGELYDRSAKSHPSPEREPRCICAGSCSGGNEQDGGTDRQGAAGRPGSVRSCWWRKTPA